MNYKKIGVIHTPYSKATHAPYQPVDSTVNDTHLFFVELSREYIPALANLESFRYLYLIYHIDRIHHKVTLTVSPPWTNGVEVGLFASRSPLRPNPIGLSVIRIISIKDSRIYTSGLDVFNKTPLLDIKPYINDLDNKPDANCGWIDSIPDKDHLTLHIKGIPHDY